MMPPRRRNLMRARWRCMIARCENPNSADFVFYGARGISVCETWRTSFDAYLADVGPSRPGMELDRANNDGDYEPGNVRWVTKTDNRRNKRNTINLTAFGETRTMGEWSERTGIQYSTIRMRVRAGWTPEQTVALPPHFGQRVAKAVPT